MPKQRNTTHDGATATRRYRVTAPKDWPADDPPFGLDYEVGGKPVRAEAGEVAGDLPPQSVPWLLDAGLIEEVR